MFSRNLQQISIPSETIWKILVFWMLKSIEMIKKLDKKLVNMLAELRQDYVVKYLCLKISSILI